MTKNIVLSIAFLFFGFAPLLAQEETDAFIVTGISDEQTEDPEMNAKWRTGEETYSSEPDDAWELGVSLGHLFINGDVPTYMPSGFGVGLHVRKAINYTLSWRLEGLYGQTRGVDGRLSSASVLNLDNPSANLPAGYRTYRNYKATNISGAFSLFVNVGNILFHQPSPKWNLYLGGGLAVTKADVSMNYLNGSSQYDWSAIHAEYDDDNSRAQRGDILDALDDSWETDATHEENVPLINGNSDVFFSFLGTIGVSRKLSKRFNLSLEQQIFLQSFDKWDGHEYRTTADQSNNSDMGLYTNLRLGVNLGNMQEKTEPLYWLNPLDASFNDIAELKRRPVFDLTDTDGDGVIDMLDQEIESKEGCPVDTRGILLDSDGDGIADCDDKEPYSPIGFEIDEDGVAQVDYTNEEDVNEIIDTRVPAIVDNKLEEFDGCGNWFLPMIHFDNDKYSIKPEYYSQLHHVANVMKMCPNMCVTAYGHTDPRASEEYNNVLSYNRAKAAVDYLVTNYGIDRNRIRLMYGGESTPLINNSRSSAQNYMNRRVEFRVCQPGDSEMTRPEGAEAGTGSRSGGSGYMGNKNSGY